eukprot:1136394-Pelagomonas_calceolata.AAC.12
MENVLAKAFNALLLTSSHPDAILITPYQAKPTSSSPSSSCSHYALHSRCNATQRTCVANRVRHPHQLNPNWQHVNLIIGITYCEDTRPGQRSEVAQRQHANLCNLTNAKAVTLHTIVLGVGGTCYREHTLNQFEQLGLDHQRAMKLAHLLHAHSVEYAHKLVTTKRAIENKNTFHSQVLEPGASSDPPDPH